MLIKKYIQVLLIIVSVTLCVNVICNKANAQNDGYDPETPIIDSIDIGENLLDSNEVYKKQFDSLSKDGEWLKTNKTDLIRDLENISEKDLDFDIQQTNEVVYVWRPYGTNSYWNPYFNGHWAFTNYGWMWLSNYSWGWGPYNYGRWYFSGYYGWIWLPGIRWAPNWVTWRYCNNYVGWYPTCPQVYWWGKGHRRHTNRLFASLPKNWVFVNKKDFTKKIDNNVIVSKSDNTRLLKNSVKLTTSVYDDPSGPKIKYNGPDVNLISKESGVKITPQDVTLVRSEDNGYIDLRFNDVSGKEESNTGKTKDEIANTNVQTVKTREDNIKVTDFGEQTKDEKTSTESNDKKSSDDKKRPDKSYNVPPPDISVEKDRSKQQESTKKKEKSKNLKKTKSQKNSGNRNSKNKSGTQSKTR